MFKSENLKRRRTGIILIIIGLILVATVLVLAYFRTVKINGIPEILPAQKTIAYLEFPTNLDPDLTDKLNQILKTDWNANVAPWTQEKAVIAFLSSSPLVLIPVKNADKAFDFLKIYNNPGGEVKKAEMSGVSVYSTAATYFTFVNDILVLSPSAESMNSFLSYQGSMTQHLSSESDFMRIRKNLNGQFFAYIRPGEAKEMIYTLLARFAPSTPFLSMNSPAIGLSANKNGNLWQGSSYVISANNISFNAPQPYRASLLPFLPSESEVLISGQNLPVQTQEINEFIGENEYLPPLDDFWTQISKDYFPGLDFKKDVLGLFNGEFAFTENAGNILFVSEATDPNFAENIKKVMDSFKTIAGKFTPTIRDLTLPDKTKAQELIPDNSKIRDFHESFDDFDIGGILLGQQGGIYYALAQNKCFISNDISTLRKILVLTKVPGANFRESDAYKTFLQPILKNPELTGVANTPYGTFGFSKRMFPDHMETNFVFAAMPLPSALTLRF